MGKRTEATKGGKAKGAAKGGQARPKLGVKAERIEAEKLKRIAQSITVYKGGRPKAERPGVDRGTDELQRRRALDQGKRRNPQLLEYPLGVLYEHDQITTEMWEAGCRYAWLYGRAVGRQRARACQAATEYAEGRQELDEGTEVEIERDFREAADLLAGVPAIKRIVDDLVVFERRPEWLGPCFPTVAHMTEASLLQVGLTFLARLMVWQRAHRRRDVDRRRAEA